MPIDKVEPTLADEIRALLEMVTKRDSYAVTFRRDSQVLWDAFPSLAAKMLAVIEERDELRLRLTLSTEIRDGGAVSRLTARMGELEKEHYRLRSELSQMQEGPL